MCKLLWNAGIVALMECNSKSLHYNNSVSEFSSEITLHWLSSWKQHLPFKFNLLPLVILFIFLFYFSYDCITFVGRFLLSKNNFSIRMNINKTNGKQLLSLGLISMCSSFFVLTFVLVKFYVLFLLDGNFLHQAGLKLTLIGLLQDILVLLLVEVFFVGVWGNLLELFLYFLKFRLLWLLSFMGLYMLWRKLKRWGLLMSGWNVILLWFVLCLLLGQMFLGCFVIDGMLVLITVRKLGLRLLIFFMKEMRMLISWLI